MTDETTQGNAPSSSEPATQTQGQQANPTYRAIRWHASTEELSEHFSGELPIEGSLYAFQAREVTTAEGRTAVTLNFVRICGDRPLDTPKSGILSVMPA